MNITEHTFIYNAVLFGLVFCFVYQAFNQIKNKDKSFKLLSFIAFVFIASLLGVSPVKYSNDNASSLEFGNELEKMPEKIIIKEVDYKEKRGKNLKEMKENSEKISNDINGEK